MKSLEKTMEPACRITRYDCPQDKTKLDALIEIAKQQQDSFESIFPWNQGCTAPRHYVAQRADGTICGWAAVVPRTSNPRRPDKATYKFLYLSEISVIRTQDESFKGVGKRLHDRLVEDATKEGQDFIYLYPLNEGVKATYINKWGYTPLDGTSLLLYKVKPDREIPVRLIRKLSPTQPGPRFYTTQALTVVQGNPDAEAIVRDRSLARNVQEHKTSLANLGLALNEIAMYELMEEEGTEEEIPTREERQQMIVDIFLAAPKAPELSLKGGRRKTHRRPRRRRTLRKRKVKNGSSVVQRH